jgi:hypothetical protein
MAHVAIESGKALWAIQSRPVGGTPLTVAFPPWMH